MFIGICNNKKDVLYEERALMLNFDDMLLFIIKKSNFDELNVRLIYNELIGELKFNGKVIKNRDVIKISDTFKRCCSI